jgi:amidase
MKPLHELTASEAAALIARNEITSEALVTACLERITAREQLVGAWQHLDSEQALQQARARDSQPRRGALHGIPIGIKDIIDTVDMPTCYGSPIYQGTQPAWDAACVAALRAAGAVILGKTVTTEFAVYQPGKTANPHNLAHTPGGSSSGSAAAVADRMVPLALGTQTAGSIIRPASFCGVIGYKPSYGLVNRAGLKPSSELLDTIGVFARSVADAAISVAVMSGRAELSTIPTVGAAQRIGFCRTPQWPHAEAATQQAFDDARKSLAAAGATIVDIELPGSFDKLAEAQTDIMAYESSRALTHEFSAHREQLSGKLLELIKSGQDCPPDVYDEARSLAACCRAALSEVYRNIDFIVAPSVKGEAPAGLDATGDPIFNRIWTLLHVPCVNIPATTSSKGLPVGLQVIGQYGSDRQTLSMADWVEKACKD